MTPAHRGIRQVRIDLPTRSSYAYFFVNPGDRGWDPWWGALYDYLLSFASPQLAWEHEPVQNVYVARPTLTDQQRQALFSFLRTAPKHEAEDHRSLKRALALSSEQQSRVELMYFADAENE